MSFEARHLKPPETFVEKDRPKSTHRLLLEEGGETMGYVDLIYFGSPFRFYYTPHIRLEEKFRNQKNASKLYEIRKQFLDKKGVPCFFQNGFEETGKGDHLAKKFGWEPVAGRPYWYSYGLPPELQAKVSQAIYVITGNYEPSAASNGIKTAV